MTKRARQYIGLLCAVIVYYVVHEGAHLLYALAIGVFKEIHFMGLGIQIDVYAERMGNAQMGLFCLVGAASTMLMAYGLTFLAPTIGRARSKLLRACAYYVTMAMLLLDPLYLSLLCGLFGGGDMNGIALLLPAWLARTLFGLLLAGNGLLFWKTVLPVYQRSFARSDGGAAQA